MILDKLKGVQILKFVGVTLDVWRFAALKAIQKPLKICLKYARNLILDENVLQAGWRVMKASGDEGFWHGYRLFT